MHNLTCVAAAQHAVALPVAADAPPSPVAALAVDGAAGARFVATVDGGVCRVEKDGTVRGREGRRDGGEGLDG